MIDKIGSTRPVACDSVGGQRHTRRRTLFTLPSVFTLVPRIISGLRPVR